MTKKPDPLHPATLKQSVPSVVDEHHAPIIFFDEAPNFGNSGSVLNVTLCAYRNLARPGNSIHTDLIVTAHLRCSIAAAITLRKALDDALLLGAKTQGGTN